MRDANVMARARTGPWHRARLRAAREGRKANTEGQRQREQKQKKVGGENAMATAMAGHPVSAAPASPARAVAPSHLPPTTCTLLLLEVQCGRAHVSTSARHCH